MPYTHTHTIKIIMFTYSLGERVRESVVVADLDSLLNHALNVSKTVAGL